MEEAIVKGLVEAIWKGLRVGSSKRRVGKDLISNYYTAAKK